jgi:pimeloyl-ACP methyl ester carboxylesterase
MTTHTLLRDGIALSATDTGAGLPVLFQHGLGGGEAQVAEVFPEPFRRLTVECRNHGASGDGGPWRIATFADDALAFADARGAQTFVAGGISMGAAIALNLAARHPQRVRGLIIARPAWLDAPAPANLAVFPEAAGYLERDDRDGFAASATAQRLAVEGPDNLASLLGFFDRPDRARLPALLRAISADGPGVTLATMRTLRVPTLVLANHLDPVHPFAIARTIAAAIPAAQCVELTPKATDRERHAQEFRAAVTTFLTTLEPA